MELDLTMQEVSCCETAHRVVVSHEETMETAIPEYCPDMARVIDAVGQLKIREKKLSGGRLTVSGTVRVTVLYASGESAGLRSLQLTVPFSCLIDDERLTGCRSVCGSGRLQLVEARAITARKLYVRVMPEFEVEGIANPVYRFCTGIPEDPTLQTKRTQREVQMLKGVVEREFNFNQECMPEPGKPLPEELLLDRVSLRITGCQRITGKLILKGEAAISVLYRLPSQELHQFDTILPFSQIMEAGELAEGAVFQADAWAIDSDIRLSRTGESVSFGVSMRIGVAVRVYGTIKLDFIADLYSTRCESSVKQEKLELMLPQPKQMLRQEVVEHLEFGTGKPFASVIGMECDAVSLLPEEIGTVMRTNLRLKLLYLDDTGAPVSTERTVEVSMRAPYMPETVRATCAPVTMNLSGNSCELRIPVDFFMEKKELLELEAVASAELQESSHALPSVLLLRVGEKDDMWSIAKSCRTDPKVICRINELSEDGPLPKGMLLIPRVGS